VIFIRAVGQRKHERLVAGLLVVLVLLLAAREDGGGFPGPLESGKVTLKDMPGAPSSRCLFILEQPR
jgi:hypothetical protein